MSELNGLPYVCAWESNQRDYRNSRVIKFRVCFPLRMTKRLSRPFRDRGAAERYAAMHDGHGVRLTGAHPDSDRQQSSIRRTLDRQRARSQKVNA